MCGHRGPEEYIVLLAVGYGREFNQGRIEPPRGYATSNSANIDSIVRNVTKNRGPCGACKTAHTIKVLISIFYM